MSRSLSSMRAFTIGGAIAIAGVLSITTLAVAQDAVTSNPQSSIGDATETVDKKGFFEQVGNRLGSLDIKLKAKILDLELIDGLKTALDYRYELEPSYTGEYHLRMDRMTLNNDVNVGELLNQATKHVGLELKHGTEILYVRPFKSKKDAALAVPFGYTSVPTTVKEALSRLPLSSQNVIDNLDPGDFFSFSAHMDVIVGVSSLPITMKMPANLSTHYLVSGQFQIYLIKGQNQKLLMKLVAIRKREWSLAATLGIVSDHKVFGLRLVDRRIVAVTNLTKIFQLSYSKIKSNLAMVDYVLDMKDARVRDAYDGVVAKVLKFKTIAIGNPFSSNEELTDKLLSDITPFETIYAEEKIKALGNRAIDRNFKGKNDVDVAEKSLFWFAPIIMKYTKETEYFENMLISVRPDESLDYYRLHTFQRTNEVSWWFSYFKGTSVSRASLLFDSDTTKQIGKLRDISFDWNYRDKSLTAKELRMIKNAVQQAVPSSIHGTIDWGPFKKEQEYENARFSYKMLLHPDALRSVQNLGSGNIYELLNLYLKTIPTPSAEPMQTGFNQTDGAQMRQTFEDKYRDTLLNIAHYMAKVVDLSLTNQERSDAFAELRFNDLFIEIGPGFMVSLLPQKNLFNLVSFEITMVADETPEMKPFRFGKVIDRSVYQAASQMQAILTANEFETITQMMKNAEGLK